MKCLIHLMQLYIVILNLLGQSIELHTNMYRFTIPSWLYFQMVNRTCTQVYRLTNLNTGGGGITGTLGKQDTALCNKDSEIGHRMQSLLMELN